MCGICGFTGREDKELLKKMADRIRHRGPDAEGLWSDGFANLASRRLAIVDINDGFQPMSDEYGNVHIVWNGEVYNHRKLRKELEAKGYVFKTSHSDTEVLINMYLEYGEDFVNHLNGMFAIAIWDKRSEKLILYRDRLGVKTLYYTDMGGTNKRFIFSSEIKSMLIYPDCSFKINDAAIYQYFSYKNINAPDTAYEGISELMPGQKLVYNNGRISRQFYWNISDYYFDEKTSFDKEDAESRIIPDIVERLDEIICDAVKIRLDADVEIGAFLSGGLDSSLISVLAAGDIDRMKCFTLGHETSRKQDYDKQADIDNAVYIAGQYNMEQYIRFITAGNVIKRLENIERCFDQPFSGSLSTYMMAEYIDHRVKTVLSGDGADELFGSYLPHMLSFPMEYFSKCTNQGNEIVPGRLKPLENEIPYISSMYEFSKGNEELLSYRMLLMTDSEKKLFLGERLSRYADDMYTLKQIKMQRENLGGRDVLNRNLEYDCRVLLPNQVLKFTDVLSMAHSVEVRSPFLDYRLVELMAGISGRYKIYNGETKYLLKKVAGKYLPKQVIYRKKEGFTMPVNDWLQEELREYVFDILTPDAVLKYGFIRPETVYFILKKYYENPAQNSYLAGTIWNFLCFQKWCETIGNISL